ncbi:unnamed protein product, partial [marine sediment metagenome]
EVKLNERPSPRLQAWGKVVHRAGTKNNFQGLYI